MLNKYIPADFDPRLVPRSKRPKDDLVPVRMMLPFSVQCTTCSSFLYRGRKFNSKKEPVKGPEGKYLGIQRFRFHIKCSVCSRPVTFLTDPKNADYEMESGATRNYDVHKDKERTKDEIDNERAEEEKADAMKALENRVLASQREVADLDNLDEIKAMNLMHLRVLSRKGGGSSGAAGVGLDKGNAPGGSFDGSAKAVLDAMEWGKQDVELNENGLTASEEAMVKSIRFGKPSMDNTGEGESGGDTLSTIKRLDDEDERRAEELRQREEATLERQQKELAAKAVGSLGQGATSRLMPEIKVRRKRILGTQPQTLGGVKKPKASTCSEEKEKSEDNAEVGLSGLLGAYGSNTDSD